MDNEIIKIHVWELPEKTDDIDTSEYIIIHDGYAVKKSTVEKLFEYLAQDYKVENTIRYFDILMETENKKYDELYSTLENSIDYYEEIINKLGESFTNNRNTIRELETASNQINTDMNSISDSFTTVENKCTGLSNSFNELIDITYESEIKRYEINIEIDKLYKNIFDIDKFKNSIDSNNAHIVESADRILENIDTRIETDGSTIISNINAGYDKILSILDHYHHVET